MYTELKSKSTNSYFNQKSFHGSVLLSICQKISSVVPWFDISLFTQQSCYPPGQICFMEMRKSLNFILPPILLLIHTFDNRYFGLLLFRTGGGIWFVPVSDSHLICFLSSVPCYRSSQYFSVLSAKPCSLIMDSLSTKNDTYWY